MNLRRFLRSGSIGILVGGLVLTGSFLRVNFVHAAACTITTNTTIDQAYITTNTCNTIDISGTTTIIWSGTTDLVGDGAVTVSGGTVTFSGAVVLGGTDSFTVSSGATVTHVAEVVTAVNITAANITIASGGSIDVTAKGCGSSKGPDVSNVCTNKGTGADTGGTGGEGMDGYNTYFGGGGGHGGAGGNGGGGGTNDSAIYPNLFGSGGGTGLSSTGGLGGGIIKLTATGALTVDGTLTADGTPQASYGGGGAGGSIVIRSGGILSGSGSFLARGGSAGAVADAASGSGGGGRIAVYYGAGTPSTLIANALASAGTVANVGVSGGVGSVLFASDPDADDTPMNGLATAESADDDWILTGGLTLAATDDDVNDATLNITLHNFTLSATGIGVIGGGLSTINFTVDNALAVSGDGSFSCGHASAQFNWISVASLSWADQNMTCPKIDWGIDADLAFTGSAIITASLAQTAGSMTVNANSSSNKRGLTLSGTSSWIGNILYQNATTLTVNSGASLSANGLGCIHSTGPDASNVCTNKGAGADTGGIGGEGGDYGPNSGGGGGYGGAGGTGGYGAAGGTYGSSTDPVSFGSGGGDGLGGFGGAGGGIIRIVTTGAMSVGGTISASGGTGVSYGGGASGGTVNITASGEISGAGSIEARGGSAGRSDSVKGGGGRIAVRYVSLGGEATILSNLVVTTGSVGAWAGASGTTYTLQLTVASTPTVSTPTTGTYNASATPTVSSSTYSSNGASHTSSDWKVTSDSGGLTTVWSKDADASNLTSIVVNTTNGTFSGALAGQTQLVANTMYYAFVRYNNAAGASSWSTAINFTTIATTNSSTQTWDFGTAADYSYNSSYVSVSSGVGQLVDLGGGTYIPSSMSSWSKRAPLTVTEGSGSTLTNFQTKVVVTYDADMKADFSDLRFTSVDGGTLLDHWLESKTDSTTATFWVEIPTLTASSATTIYMYYGNAAVTTASSGANTFLFFDDFSGSSLNAQWTSSTGTATVSGGELTLGASSGIFASGYAIPNDTIWESSANPVATSRKGAPVRASTTSTTGWVTDGGAGQTGMIWWNTGIIYAESESSETNFTAYTAGYKKYKITYRPGNANSASFDYNNAAATTTIATAGASGTMHPVLYSTDASSTWDWWLVRKYASTVPSVATGIEAATFTYDQASLSSVTAATPSFTALGTFTETRGVTGGQGSTYYNLSLDGVNWKYWNGTVWATASSGNYNSAAVVNSYLPQFTTDIGAGSLYFKAFLVGASQPVEINTLVVTYASINVSLTAATQSVAESVGTVTVTAQLSTASGSTVTIPYTVSGTATAGGVDHTLANGNIVVTAGLTTGDATFSVVNDALDENDETVIVTLGAPDVGSLSGVTEQTITITDNDTSGFTVGAISGNTTEAGGTATATIVLTSLPSADVSIGLTSSNTAEGTVSPASFTFTALNWSTPQTLTVTGVNDAIDDGDIAYSIVTAAAASVDSLYNNINPADISVTNTDDDTAGITVGTISGSTTEAGGTATATIVLTSEPTASVIVGLSSSNAAEGTVSPASFTFTTVNWATPQTVTATGVNDDVDDGDIFYSIVTAAATSSDVLYSAMNPTNIAVTNADDDTAGITVSLISGNSTEAGATATATIVLTSESTGDVTIGLSSSDTTEGTVSPASATFTALNWATPQTLTVTGVNDDVDDGNIGYSIITATATSTDGNYSVINPTDISVTNADDDTFGMVLTESSGATAVKEGEYTDTYTIVLSTQPTSSVAVAVASTTSQATPTPTPLTFTTVNWATPQTITVTAVDDSAVESSQSDSFTHTVTSGDSLYNGFSLASVAVAMVDNDHRGSSVTHDPVLEAAKTITVTAPAIHSTIVGGSVVHVEWNSTGVIPIVSVFLSVDAGATWTIERYNIANTNSATFIAPSTATSHAVVKVEGTDLVAVLASNTSDEFVITVPAEEVPSEVLPDTIPSTNAGAVAEVAARVAALPPSVYINMLVKLVDDGDPNTQGDSSVYSVGADGYRHAFPNADVYFSWYTDFTGVITLSAPDLAQIPLGSNVTYKPGVRMVKFQSSPKVYAVDRFGILRWVTGEDVAIQLYGFLWNTKVNIISDAFFGNYTFGTNILGYSDFNPDAFSSLIHPSDSIEIPGYTM